MPNPQSSTTPESRAAAQHDREIFRLAVPAFFTMVTEPLYLIADSVIIGHLGTQPLAGLGIAASILGVAVGMCIFLAYGTTGAVARFVGAGDLRGGYTQGIAGLWLAVFIAVTLVGGGQLLTPWLIGVFEPTAAVATQATVYLQVAWFGVLAQLLMLAATGVLRGFQDTRTPLLVALVSNLVNVALNVFFVYGLGLGIVGSAWGTSLAQMGSAAALVGVVVAGARRHQASLRPEFAGIRSSGKAATPLVVRSAALLAVTTSTTYLTTRLAVGRAQDVNIAAHQVAMTLWFFLAYVLDALAIAGQAMTGRYLGSGDVRATQAVTRRMLTWGWRWGLLAGVCVAAFSSMVPMAFTQDDAVRETLSRVLLVLAAGLPLCGVAFVLDGILIGAGDNVFLAQAQVAALVIYLPLAWASVRVGNDLTWLWAAFGIAWIAVRCGFLMHRQRSGKWLVTGLPR
jgi:putative MATE family efflux protein